MADGYIVVTEANGAFGVFNNPDVAHAWTQDNFPGSDIFRIKKPESLPDLFLYQLHDASA